MNRNFINQRMKIGFFAGAIVAVILSPFEGKAKCKKGYICCSGLKEKHVKKVKYGDKNFEGTTACVRIWREGCWIQTGFFGGKKRLRVEN